MESAEQHRAEVERPDTVVDFLESHVLVEQAVADVDPAILPADAAVLADLSDFEVSGVLGLRQAIGETARRGLVELCGRSALKRLVRPLVVELESEGVKEALLGTGVSGRGPGRLGLEGSVHALVPSVLLGMGGLYQLRADAQADPPDREAREAADGRGGGKRHAVVGADDFR